MGREVPSGLQPLLDLPSCETQSTLDLYLTDTSEYHFSTRALSSIDIGTDTVDYTADLRSVDIIKQSILAATDRVTAVVQNVDKTIGEVAALESLTHAVAVVGRYYTDPAGVESPMWVELFRGEAFPTQIDEKALQIEILNDLAATGYCVAAWTLAENCQFIFKESATCGYSGGETTCNKKRKSDAGCIGRSNDHHFGGMEFPDFQTASVDVSGGGDTGTGGDINPNCPRVDQWIPVSGPQGQIEVKQARYITTDDLVCNPKTKLFERVKSARIVKDQPIWCIAASAGIAGYSSPSHPVFPYIEHVNGIAVRETFDDDPLLLWRRQDRKLIDDFVLASFDTGDIDDVVRIELEAGHVYAYGDNEDLFIACHNSKWIGGLDY